MSTVKMQRDAPVFPGGPVTANVHSDDVNSWRLHDWVVCDAVEGAGPETEEVQATPLSDLTVKQLKALAKEHGVALVRGVNTKEEIAAALQAAGV